MKLLVAFLFIATNSYASGPSQPEVRALFHKAATEEKACIHLIKKLDGYNEKNNPLLAGYKACATMMLAKYSFNPFTKLSNFWKGKTLLEKSIAADKQSIELRFLRYTIQKKAPLFLQYRSSIKEDELMVTKALPKLNDSNLKIMIVDFLRQERVIK